MYVHDVFCSELATESLYSSYQTELLSLPQSSPPTFMSCEGHGVLYPIVFN